MRHVVGIHTRRSLASLICSIDLISLPWLYIKFSWVHSHIAIRIFLAINLPGWRAHLGLSQPPLRTGTLTQTYQPLIWQNQTTHPPTPWQAFKMALVVSSFNTTLHPRCSPPPPLAKRARLWGVHWHRTGWRLFGCTPTIHLEMV